MDLFRLLMGNRPEAVAPFSPSLNLAPDDLAALMRQRLQAAQPAREMTVVPPGGDLSALFRRQTPIPTSTPLGLEGIAALVRQRQESGAPATPLTFIPPTSPSGRAQEAQGRSQMQDYATRLNQALAQVQAERESRLQSGFEVEPGARRVSLTEEDLAADQERQRLLHPPEALRARREAVLQGQWEKARDQMVSATNAGSVSQAKYWAKQANKLANRMEGQGYATETYDPDEVGKTANDVRQELQTITREKYAHQERVAEKKRTLPKPTIFDQILGENTGIPDVADGRAQPSGLSVLAENMLREAQNAFREGKDLPTMRAIVRQQQGLTEKEKAMILKQIR